MTAKLAADASPQGDAAADTSFADAFKEFSKPEGGNNPTPAELVAKADAGTAADEAPAEEQEQDEEPEAGAKDEVRQPVVASAAEEPRRPAVTKGEGFDPLPLSDPIWKGATQKQRAAYEDVAKRIRSDNGRVRAYQARVADSERTITNLTSQLETIRRPATPPKRADAAKIDPMNADDWKAFKTEYPGVAESIEKPFNALLEQNRRLEEMIADQSGRVNGITTAMATQAVEANYSTLDTLVPNWETIRDSAQYAEWLDAQPSYVRAVVASNRNTIRDPHDVADVFQKFLLETAAERPPGTGISPAATGSPASTITAHRRRQLDGSRTVQSKGPAPVPGVPDDFAAAFAHYSQVST